MPKNPNVKKVLVIGSGPIVIGQAAEFDYAGTQACRSLKEEGVEVVLVNSNPATIMTDKDIADSVYIEPLTVKVLQQLIEKEKPDSILPTLGGQAGLNLGMELEESGFLAAHHVTLLGTTAATIKKAEDRQEFKDTMSTFTLLVQLRLSCSRLYSCVCDIFDICANVSDFAKSVPVLKYCRLSSIAGRFSTTSASISILSFERTSSPVRARTIPSSPVWLISFPIFPPSLNPFFFICDSIHAFWLSVPV